MKIDIPDDLWALWCWYCGSRSNHVYGELIHTLLNDMTGECGLCYDVDRDVFYIDSFFDYYDKEYPNVLKMPLIFNNVIKKYFMEDRRFCRAVASCEHIEYISKTRNQVLKTISDEVKQCYEMGKLKKTALEEIERKEYNI